MLKKDVLAEICELADIPVFETTVGSSIPSDFFTTLLERFGLDTSGNMPERGKRIVEFAGLKWTNEFDSNSSPSGGGGTVTMKGLDAIHNAVIKLLEKEYSLGIDYKEPNLESSIKNMDPFEVDPNVIDKSTLEHKLAQKLFSDWLLKKGIKPLSPYPTGPQFDLAYFDKEKFVVEVKSIKSDNESKQIRLAIGQVLEYSYEANAIPVIMLSQKPLDPKWHNLMDFLKIKFYYPELLV